jgi:HSP20 family protein
VCLGKSILKTKKSSTMTLVKVNNRPAVKTWNGLLNELFADFNTVFGNLPGEVTGLKNPPVNIVETDDGYHLELLAPGRKKEAFSLKVENDQLILGYEAPKSVENVTYRTVRTEFTTGNFSRTFNLGELVQADAIQAKYEDGILRVFLPKKPEEKPATQQISIQ